MRGYALFRAGEARARVEKGGGMVFSKGKEREWWAMGRHRGRVIAWGRVEDKREDDALCDGGLERRRTVGGRVASA